jgi:hypothetical protein
MLAAKSAETNTWTRSATSKGDAERAFADNEALRGVAKTRRRANSWQNWSGPTSCRNPASRDTVDTAGVPIAAGVLYRRDYAIDDHRGRSNVAFFR